MESDDLFRLLSTKGPVSCVLDESPFGAFVRQMEGLLCWRGTVPLTEIDALARREGFRTSAVIDDLVISGMAVDYGKGVLVHLGTRGEYA